MLQRWNLLLLKDSGEVGGISTITQVKKSKTKL